jgi:hypothetical protein
MNGCRTRRIRHFGLCLLAVWLLVAHTMTVVRAQSVLEDTSLNIVPDDVAFYSVMLRNREQFDILTKSKAYQKVRQNPFVALGLLALRQQWSQPQDPQLAELKAMLNMPENQQLLALLAEAVGDEVFLYGDTGFADQLVLFNRLNSASQTAQLEAIAQGDDPSSAQMQAMFEALVENADDLQVPVMVIGFKIKNRQAADAQLARLEQLLQAVAAHEQQLQGRVERKRVSGGEYLEMSLDGTLVPWEEIRREVDDEDALEQLDELIEKLKTKTFVIAIGARDDYLLVSFGPSDEHLAQLGTGTPLAERDELEPLKNHLNERITGVDYISGEFLARLSNIDAQLEQAEAMIQQVLSMAELDDDTSSKIEEMLSSFFDAAAESIPEPQAMMGYSFLTPRGYEAFTYDWTEHPASDSSEQLSILQHVGGRPLLFVVGNSKQSPEDYDHFVGALEQMYEVGNEIALSKLEGEERASYEKLRDALLPIAKRLDEANREYLMPALASGQGGLVIDAKLTSDRVQNMMPMASQPLPIPEIAIISAVTDADKLKKGAQAYFSAAQDAIDAVRRVAPNEVPPIQIPRPLEDKGSQGTVYYYPFPDHLGLDSNLALNAGLSQDTLVLSLSPATSHRLMQATPLVKEGMLAETGKPLGGAFYFDFAGLVDTVTPWIRYGVGISQDLDMQNVVLPFEDVLEVLKCFQNVSGVTYQDDDAWVTHSEIHLRDLP